MEIILDSLEKTKEFGFLLGQLCKGGMVLCLNGDLGAGKTTITVTDKDKKTGTINVTVK